MSELSVLISAYIKHVPQDLKSFYLKYIDDIFMIRTDSDESLVKFVEDFRKVNGNIKFTMTKSKSVIAFLDVKLTNPKIITMRSRS